MNIDKLLIANRGEIACRIARTCRRLGIAAIGVHSQADTMSRHVRRIGESILIGGAAASASYLKADAIIEAAKSNGAQAIHPGYGFLSENPDFAAGVEAAGLIFIGPSPETLRRFGNKAQAKQAALGAGLRVIEGAGNALTDPAEIGDAVQAIGLPVLLKAAGGGGGRGLRRIDDLDGLEQSIEAAMREAESAFGFSGLLIERLIENARHVEVQIAGDGMGGVLHLYERDCSLQRRYQKVVEEAPAPGLDRGLVDRICTDAVALCKAHKYRGLGTVEFLVRDSKHWFLEVNPRLQVEHPVTEAVTGLDLVELQLRIACGNGMGLDQADIRLDGHAIEARLYSEDPSRDFTPSTGRINGLAWPPDTRLEAGVDDGDEVTPHYDPLIAKLIARGASRDAALSKLESALAQTAVGGIATNKEFLIGLLGSDEVRRGEIHTRLIDGALNDILAHGVKQPGDVLRAAATAAIWLLQRRGGPGDGPWQRGDFTGWRIGTGAVEPLPVPVVRLFDGASSHAVRLSAIGQAGEFVASVDDGQSFAFSLQRLSDCDWQLATASDRLTLRVRAGDERIVVAGPLGAVVYEAHPYLSLEDISAIDDGAVVSPLMGLIIKVNVEPGTSVRTGDTIAILESMKMEIPIKVPMDGRVEELNCGPGAMVERGQVLAIITAEME